MKRVNVEELMQEIDGLNEDLDRSRAELIREKRFTEVLWKLLKAYEEKLKGGAGK